MNRTLIMWATAILLWLTSCGISSDPHTEQALQGVWVSTGYDMEQEFDIAQGFEFDAADHRATMRLKMIYDEDMGYELIAHGRWKADRHTLRIEFDPASITTSITEKLTAGTIYTEESLTRQFMPRLGDSDHTLTLNIDSLADRTLITSLPSADTIPPTRWLKIN